MLIWVGTFLLVVVAIPETIPIPITGPHGKPVEDEHGRAVTGNLDVTARSRYYLFAGPAMLVITVGMSLQGRSIYKADLES